MNSTTAPNIPMLLFSWNNLWEGRVRTGNSRPSAIEPRANSLKVHVLTAMAECDNTERLVAWKTDKEF